MIEKRTRPDRRQRDIGPPPSCYERRIHAERRFGQAKELDLTDEAFAALFGGIKILSPLPLDREVPAFDRFKQVD